MKNSYEYFGSLNFVEAVKDELIKIRKNDKDEMIEI